MNTFKLIAFLVLLPIMGICQTPTRDGQLWLANSRGDAVGQADSVVARNFFVAKWVDIRFDFMIDPGLDCWFVIQPDNGPAAAYKFPKTEMSTEALSMITNLTGQANLILVLQPHNPKVSSPKTNKLVLRLL